MMNAFRLILASSSPRRAALLRQLGLDFEVIPSSVDEYVNGYKSPIKLVLSLSQQKAREVAGKVAEGVVVGADTLVVFDGKQLGKPRDEMEAKEML
ncbi:MAG: Maf family protein, partial [Bacteroidota bacterium]